MARRVRALGIFDTESLIKSIYCRFPATVDVAIARRDFIAPRKRAYRII